MPNMSANLRRRIEKLRVSASEKGRFAVVAAADHLLNGTEDVDRRINLVGAMHETGCLRNSLAPLWLAFEADNEAWSRRCLSRLVDPDFDYWALASLLGRIADPVVSIAGELGFRTFAVHSYQRFDQPPVTVASMAIGAAGEILHPLLELGWDTETKELVDCVRARAFSFNRRSAVSSELAVPFSVSYYMRALLPYGSWRSLHEEFTLPLDSIVPEFFDGSRPSST